MTMIKNSWGTEIDFDVAVSMMDDEIRENLHSEITPCTEQEFFTAYAAAHKAQFGEDWILDTENPCY